ncbi:hypothetical protein D9M69_573890 [compost metagenome]
MQDAQTLVGSGVPRATQVAHKAIRRQPGFDAFIRGESVEVLRTFIYAELVDVTPHGLGNDGGGLLQGNVVTSLFAFEALRDNNHQRDRCWSPRFPVEVSPSLHVTADPEELFA